MTKQQKPNILDEIFQLRHNDLFGYEEESTGFAEIEEQQHTPATTPKKIDLTKPPGIVGEVAEYINGQCLFPRENLAVAASIASIGNIGGLNHKLEDSRVTPNIFLFGVAGSATGKEDILQAATELHMLSGIGAATHGTIKSEQEVIRNLIEHQASYYLIDEIGLFLKKVQSASNSNGASYLQNVIAALMSIYSKARSSILVSGDIKRQIKADLKREYAYFNKELDNGCDNPAEVEERMLKIKEAINSIDNGLVNPFLSLIGFTTPETFNGFVDVENVTSGFIGRSIIINEPNNNPKKKPSFKPIELSDDLRDRIIALRSNGSFDQKNYRVESNGNFNVIKTDQDALHELENISELFWKEAESQTEKTGFEAVVRRGYEMVEKVSFILSFGSESRTLEHVDWAFEYIKRDIRYKTLLAYSNVKEKSDPVESMAAKIMCGITDDGITVGRIVNRYRAKRDLVLKAIDFLVSKGKVKVVDKVGDNNRKVSVILKA